MIGRVAIHYHTHLQETSLSACIESLARHYPDVHLSVVHGSEQHPSLDMLRREVADIVILPSTVLDEHFMEHLHWTDRYVLVVAKNKCPAPHSFEQLCETMRYVAWRHPGVDRLHSQMAAANVRFSHRGELSCVDTLLGLVAKGHCLSVLPTALLPRASPAYQYLKLPFNAERRISVVARPTSLLSNAANTVLEGLKQYAVNRPLR